MSSPSDETASQSDAERGNLDGTTATDTPREESLDEAKSAAQTQGNGSFDDAAQDDTAGTDAAQTASDVGGSGQDNGSMS